MSRARLLALTGVGVLVAAALALPPLLDDDGGDGAPQPVAVSERTRALQRAAALAPCPTGLGPEMPAGALRCLGGGPDVDLRAPLTTGPTVVNVWGSWCGPCLREVPALVRFAEAAKGKVALVGIDTSDVDDYALDYAADAGMSYPSLVDTDAAVSTAFGPGVPKTILLDAAGKVVHVARGELTYDALTALVDRHLGVRL